MSNSKKKRSTLEEKCCRNISQALMILLLPLVIIGAIFAENRIYSSWAYNPVYGYIQSSWTFLLRLALPDGGPFIERILFQ